MRRVGKRDRPTMGSSAKAGGFAGFLRDRRGNITPLMVIVLIPLLGAFALAAEVSGWHTVQRSMQNAADAAVVAAATNASATVAPTYIEEARAVAKRFGYTHGVNNTLVTAVNGQTCPSPSTNTDCYKVTISRDVSLGLTRAVGFSGNQSSGARERVVASAMASPKSAGANPCMAGMSTTGDSKGNSFATSGTPKFDAGGCPAISNASANCNSSHDLNISSMSAVGTGDCSTSLTKMASPYVDPFKGLSTDANIPSASSCTAAPSINLTVTPNYTWNLTGYPSTGPLNLCGSPKITGTGVITISTAAPGSVLIINNGADFSVPKGVTIQTTGTTGLTVVFSGATTQTPGFLVQSDNSGTAVFDWGAPSSGPWSGIAVYQDDRMKTVSARTYTGNSPDFKLSGLLYAPHTDIEVKGAIGHHTGGYRCFGLMANTITIKGTGSVYSDPTGQCSDQGLSWPAAPGSHPRALLVQ